MNLWQGAARWRGILTIFEQKKTNISSLWASLSKKTATAVDKFNEKIDELR